MIGAAHSQIVLAYTWDLLPLLLQKQVCLETHYEFGAGVGGLSVRIVCGPWELRPGRFSWLPLLFRESSCSKPLIPCVVCEVQARARCRVGGRDWQRFKRLANRVGRVPFHLTLWLGVILHRTWIALLFLLRLGGLSLRLADNASNSAQTEQSLVDVVLPWSGRLRASHACEPALQLEGERRTTASV